MIARSASDAQVPAAQTMNLSSHQPMYHNGVPFDINQSPRLQQPPPMQMGMPPMMYPGMMNHAWPPVVNNQNPYYNPIQLPGTLNKVSDGASPVDSGVEASCHTDHTNGRLSAPGKRQNIAITF